ncbi:MAG: hypothetical protein QXP36_13365 [Conexivisphaerales archaeon]
MPKLVNREKFEKECPDTDNTLLIVNSLGDWAILLPTDRDIIASSDKVMFYPVDDQYSQEDIKEMFEDIKYELASNGAVLKNPRKIKAKVKETCSESQEEMFFFIIFPNGEWAFISYYFEDLGQPLSEGVKTFEIDDSMSVKDILEMVENPRVRKLLNRHRFKTAYQNINNALLVVNSLGEWAMLDGNNIVSTRFNDKLHKVIDDKLSKDDIETIFKKIKTYKVNLKDADRLKEILYAYDKKDLSYLTVFHNGEWAFLDNNSNRVATEGIRIHLIDSYTNVDGMLDFIETDI